MIGLPGTGLGGIFYVLLVIWMAVRETWLLMRAASHYSRWLKIAKLGSLAAAIVAALWLEGWLIYQLLGSATGYASNFYGAAGSGRELAIAAITPMLAIAPFVVLVILMLGVHTARLLLRRAQEPAVGYVIEPPLVEIEHLSR